MFVCFKNKSFEGTVNLDKVECFFPRDNFGVFSISFDACFGNPDSDVYEIEFESKKERDDAYEYITSSISNGNSIIFIKDKESKCIPQKPDFEEVKGIEYVNTEEIRKAICSLLNEIEEKNKEHVFRYSMYIQLINLKSMYENIVCHEDFNGENRFTYKFDRIGYYELCRFYDDLQLRFLIAKGQVL